MNERFSESWAGEERRSEVRRRCCYPAGVLFTACPSFRPFRAEVWNVSAFGIAFLHEAPLEPGTVLAVQVRAGRAGTSAIRTARVAHSTPFGGRWLVGCRVSPPFSAAELESL